MAAVTLSAMRALELAACADGWTEEALVDLAGEGLGRAIGRFFQSPGTCVGYLGKGHNAADAWVAMRVLRDVYGWKIATRTAFSMDQWAPVTRRKWQELGCHAALNEVPAWREWEGPLVLLDGLLGSGSRGNLSRVLLDLAAEMECLRQEAGARVAAVDLPSGMNADTGEMSAGGVTADITFMMANAKRGLLCGHAANFTGALALVSVPPLTHGPEGDMELIAPQTMGFGKSPRPFDFHKGMAGRVAVLAGSALYPGAAVLAATGALRGGAGLITLFVPQEIAAVIAAKCPLEIIVRGYDSPDALLDSRFDSLVVGCGLGTVDSSTGASLLEVIRNFRGPAVIDADALNLIAQAGLCGILDERHVITPHPGEFERLAPDLSGLPREAAARLFADRTGSTLLLKGCRSIVTRRGHPLWCNATGHPGMATGGHGDLLAGLIGARLAVGAPPLEAAALSAWLCGRSSEIALDQAGISEESLTPSDVARFLGGAFRDWRSCKR